MPVTKFQFERHEILIQLLKQKHEQRDLLYLLNDQMRFKHDGSYQAISLRTLCSDIKYLRDVRGAKIHRPNKLDKNYYLEEKFFTKVEFNEDVIYTLKSSIEILKNIQGFSVANDMERLLKKVELSGLEANDHFMAFEEQTTESGTQYIEDLAEAIRSMSAVQLVYTDFKEGKTRTFDFSPYFLKEYRNRWYVYGSTHDEDKLLNLGLDRIQMLKNRQGIQWITPKNFQPENYFNNLIGVTIPQDAQPIEILLKVSAQSAKYIKSKKIIKNQITLHEYVDGGIKIKITAYNNYELKQNLLAFGAEIQVLAPPSLIQEMKEIYSNALNQYPKK